MKRLGRTSELRVHGLVGAVGTALEEVREPTPGPVRKVRLVDDVVHAGPNRVLGSSPCRLRVEALVLARAHAKDTLASGLEPLEVATLVKVPLLANEGAVGVFQNRPLEPVETRPDLTFCGEKMYILLHNSC